MDDEFQIRVILMQVIDFEKIFRCFAPVPDGQAMVLQVRQRIMLEGAFLRLL